MIGKIFDYITDKLLTVCLHIILIGLGFSISWITGLCAMGLVILYYIFALLISIIDKSIKE